MGMSVSNSYIAVTTQVASGAIETTNIATDAQTKMVLLGSDTISGSASATLDVSGISLSGYSHYLVVANIDNAIAGGKLINCCVNNDLTITNYYSQQFNCTNAVTNISRQNDARMGYAQASEQLTMEFRMFMDVNGNVVSQGTGVSPVSTGIEYSAFSATYTSTTVADITQITLKAHDASSAFDVGSTMYVYGILDS